MAIQHDEQKRPWNVPFRRNPFFTGRDHLLNYLHEQIHGNHAAALVQSQALTGLGGIGKTQVALEYAYRYRESYEAVFWVRAASRDVLVADFVALASLLQLPGQDVQDQTIIVAAVKRWLVDSQGWLLIMDNADDLSLVADFMPSGARGSIVLTTRAQATGQVAVGIAVDKMEQDEGVQLLLRRAKVLAPDALLDTAPSAARAQAEAIVQALDGLPLALDQAGAYIEEVGCSLAEYLALYQQCRIDLLNRQSEVPSDYPHTVSSTWSLSFQQVERTNPAAADLLRLCAFLDPDIIPELIITAGAPSLGAVLAPVAANALRLHEAIGALRKFSLVKRDPEAKLLNIHRLVQAVLKSNMDSETQRLWAERAVRAVNAAFPEVTFATWPRCQQLLPHVLLCEGFIDESQFSFPEAARLLNQAGWYLCKRGLCSQAESILQRALAIREQILGTQHTDTATTLYFLAWVYEGLGKYDEAESLCQRALTIREQALGTEHPDTAATLDHLAYLYYNQGRYKEAEPLYQQALTIREQALGPEHPDVATTLYNMAWLYYNQGRYKQAESLYQRALTINEQKRGLMHPDTASVLSDLAALYSAQGLYTQAEPLVQRALAISEQTLGPEHPDTVDVIGNLAFLYDLEGKYELSEPLYQRALAISERTVGLEHPHTLVIQDNLAWLYNAQGRYEQAEPLLRRTLAVRERVLGASHPESAGTLNHLADLYTAQSKYQQAELLYQQALAIREQAQGPEHPKTALTLDSLAYLYYRQSLHQQAEPLYERALSIRKQAFGLEHPDTASTLENMALLYAAQEKHVEAESLHQQALAIRERVLGPNHPDTANSLANLASLYSVQGQFEEAEPLFQRALSIREQAQGREHLDTATTLSHLAELYRNQGQYERARSLYQRSLSIREKNLGLEHPDTVAVLKDYTELLQKLEPTTSATKCEEPDAVVFHRPEARSTSSVKSAAHPAGLTARELEVLCLLAQGLTSAQIAEQLVLSLLTVNTHVRSIYSKLGVTSRSAATRWAIEHQLL